MQVRITILRGKDTGQVRLYRIDGDQSVVIGRHEECDLPLFDEAASRRHAIVKLESGKLTLTDLGSSNGTQLNGEPVSSQALRPGDRIAIGETQFRVEIEGFHKRETVVLRPDSDYHVENSLSPDEVDLGAGVSTDPAGRLRLAQLLELIRRAQTDADGRAILDRLATTIRGALETRVVIVVPCASGSAEPLWEEALLTEGAGVDSNSLRSMIERVAREGDALRIGDVAQDPMTRQRESMVGRGVQSILVAPIRIRDEATQGVLYLDRDRDPSFSEEDLTYVATLAQVAGLALSGAERLERSRQILKTRDRQVESPILTRSAALEQNLTHLRRFAQSGGPVLVVGETGSGKELFAQEAHRSGPHSDGAFIPVNCAAIPASLLESELFGHEKGAFTGATGRKAGMFELADHGTLFLDEIGDMPLDLQPKLLRVLENGQFFRIGGRSPVTVRLLIVSATHRDLEDRVSDGEFREDLYFRLSRFQVTAPALRERPEDVSLLADHFLDLSSRKLDRELHWSDAARRALVEYSWPGNVRELRNVVERASVVASGPNIEPLDLLLSGDRLTGDGGSRNDASHNAEARSLEDVEEEAIRIALRHTGGKKGEAAEILGIAWPTLRRKLKKYEIDVDCP